MTNHAIQLNTLFQALSDPTRRAVIERLSNGPAAVTELAAPFKMTLPSFTQHLRVLEHSGLVSSRKLGRVRIYWLEPEPLTIAQEWLARQRELWERRLDQLDDYLGQMKEMKG